MNYRQLGKTGFEVSEIGYGAWGIGGSQWLGAKDDESLQALRRSIDLGLTFIDTALAYGRGHSEKLVGEVVRGRDEYVRVATKVPPKNQEWPARAGVEVDETFPGEWVRRCTEKSLANSELEAIDVQQLHVWQDSWVGSGDWIEAVRALREEGKIRSFGISINDHQPANAVEAVRAGVVDTVQVIYNVFDQTPEDELFPACLEHGVGVIVRVPFDEGALTGAIGPDTEFPEGDFRNEYFRGDRKQQVADRVDALVEDLGIGREELAEVALRFVLSHEAVSTVIPGMRSVRNAERNCAVGDGAGLPEAMVEKLRGHRWDRNFYK
ncbi:MAG TPA: aldo/keto reductase [Solirubrobacteraceae bacterium]